MADTDSALKTQLFMSESQRNNAMDLTNRINQGFQAIGQALKFKSDISQSMVSSALDLRKLEIDEWYKGEALKNEAATLKIREQELRLNNDYRKDQLAERSDYNQIRIDAQTADREYKLENARNKKDAGLALSKTFPLKTEIEIYEEKNRQLEEDKKRIEDLHRKNPDKVSFSSKNSQVRKIEELQANNIRSINANRSKIGKYQELEQRFLGGTIDRNVGYEILGMPIENLPTEPVTYENIDSNGPNPGIDPDLPLPGFEGLVPNLPDYQPPSSSSGTNTSQQPAQGETQPQAQSNYKPNTNISVFGDKQKSSDFRFYLNNTEDEAQDEFSELDLENYANNTNSDFNPEIFKQIYQKLPEDKRTSFERDISLKRASDAAKKAHASVNKLDYESNINPRYSVIVPHDDYEKQAEVLEEAKRLHVAANGGDSKSLLNSEISLQRFKDAALTVFGLNKNVTPPPAPTAPGSGKYNSDNVNVSAEERGKRIKNYQEILGGGTIESALSNADEQINRQSNALVDFETEVETQLKVSGGDKQKLLLKMAQSSPKDLGIKAGNLYGEGATPKTILERQKRTLVKSFERKSTREIAEFLASVDLEKRGQLKYYQEGKDAIKKNTRPTIQFTKEGRNLYNIK